MNTIQKAITIASVHGNDEFPVVQIKDGALRGFTTKTATGRPIHAFRRIPFAQAPIGPLRFADPVKNLPWSGVRNAIAQSPQCLQMDMMRGMEIEGQEDCLFLNVYRPTNVSANDSLPVMVWLHGGAFFFGSGSIYGPAYLLDYDIVLVTVNYRLGPLGFLSSGDSNAPGNQGMKDMVMSLHWVQDNIAVFGGTKTSVTIFGESVGGAAVHLLMISPLSQGLFSKAISHSGSAFCWWAIGDSKEVIERSKKAAEILGCPSSQPAEMIACLRKAFAQDIVGVIPLLWEWNTFPTILFGPIVEYNHPGAFLNETAEELYKNGRVKNIPWINGFTQTEFAWITSIILLDEKAVADVNEDWDRVGPIFLNQNVLTRQQNIERVKIIQEHYLAGKNFSFETRHNFAEMYSDRYIITGGLESMRFHSKIGGPTYGYRFTYPGKYSVVQATGWGPKDFGVVHLDDLMYLFDNLDYYGTTFGPSDEDFRMVKAMTKLWVSFAKDGKPDLNVWQPVQSRNTDSFPVSLLELNLSPKMLENYYGEREAFWRSH